MESQDLRKAGLKVTHPRIRILDVLESSSPRHLTAEDIIVELVDAARHPAGLADDDRA